MGPPQGAALWLVTAIATGLSDVTHLIPNVILLRELPHSRLAGPLRALRASEGHLTAEAILLGFLGGRTLGTLFAALTEVYFLPSTVGNFIGVGLFEETAKTLVVVAAGWTIADRRPRDGMVLGATVGAGFVLRERRLYAADLHRPPSRPSGGTSWAPKHSEGLLSPFGH